MKKFYLLLVAVLATCAAWAADYTVYFDNSASKWENINIYYWSADEKEPAWPGTSVTDTEEINGKTYYKYTIPGANEGTMLIWNNGNGDQTGDLKAADGHFYDKSGDISGEAKEYKIYFKDTAGWGNIHAYVFGAASNGAWPGVAITETATDNTHGEVYCYTFSTKSELSNEVKIIFNNGSNQNQTVNLVFVENAIYSTSNYLGSNTFSELGTFNSEEIIDRDIYWEAYGTFNGDWASFRLEGDEPVIKCEITPTEANGFFGVRRMRDGESVNWYAKSDFTLSESTPATILERTMNVNTAYSLTAGKTYTFYFNTGSKEVSIRWKQEVEPELRNIYIIGTLGGGDTWQTNKGLKLTETAEESNIYTGTITLAKNNDSDDNAYFNITTELMNASGNWTGLKDYRYGVSEDTEISTTETTTFAKNDDPKAFVVPAGTYIAVVDMNALNITLYTQSDLLPDALYMHGNFFDRHFDFSKPVKVNGMPGTDGDYMTYEFNNILIHPAVEGGEAGYFILSAGKAFDETPAAVKARAAAAVTPVAPAEANWAEVDNTHRYALVPNGDDTYGVNVLLANAQPTDVDKHLTEVPAYQYATVKVKLSADGNHSATLSTVDKVTTGVDAAEVVSDGEVEFYNLQGVRVANPENGIFIRRQGGKVSKVVIR